MLDVLGVQANELEEVWYVLDDGDNCLTIKDTLVRAGVHVFLVFSFIFIHQIAEINKLYYIYNIYIYINSFCLERTFKTDVFLQFYAPETWRNSPLASGVCEDKRKPRTLDEVNELFLKPGCLDFC